MLNFHQEKVLRAIEAESAKIVSQIARDIKADVDAEMNAPKTGRWYGSHRASAPGESPAKWSGNYLRHLAIAYEHLTAFIGIRRNVAQVQRLEDPTKMNRVMWKKIGLKYKLDIKNKLKIKGVSLQTF